MAERPAVKQPQKILKTPGFLDADSDDSGTKDEQESAVKQPQELPKTPGFIDTNADDEGPQKKIPGPLHKEPSQSVKKIPAASGTPVISCTYILPSGVREDKQCSLKASDETGKFWNYHKRQR